MTDDVFAIPSHGTVIQCPMCGAPVSEWASIEYHPQVIGYTMPDATCRALVIELIRQQVPIAEGEVWETFIGQHLCRKCRRCGYGWVEHPTEPHSVYTPTEESQHEEAVDSPGPG